MSGVLSITLNGVITTSPTIIDCDIVRLLTEDCGITEHISLEHPSFSVSIVQKFFTFGCVWEQSTTDLNMSALLLEFLRVANYLGCSEVVHRVLKNKMNEVCRSLLLDELSYSRVLLNCARFHTESTSPLRDTLPVDAINMTKKCCNLLLNSNNATCEELMRYSPNHRMFPLIIPQPYKDAFDTELNKYKTIVDLVSEADDCYVVGGFLVKCMKEYIMNGRLVDDDLSVSDIDVFCLNYDSLKILADRFKHIFDCRIFVRDSVITVFIRNSPVQVQLVYLTDLCIDVAMKDVDLSCSMLAYREGVLLASKSFHMMVKDNWSVNMDPQLSYDPCRVAKYSNRGFYIKDYEFNVPRVALQKWYTWTDETDEELLTIVKMIYGDDYKVFYSITQCNKFGSSIGSYGTHQHQYVAHNSHKFELIVVPRGERIELQSKRRCKVPTYTIDFISFIVYKTGDSHYIKLDDEIINTLHVIGKSMLKQVPSSDTYTTPTRVYTNWQKFPDTYDIPTLWITAIQATTLDGKSILAMEAYAM